MSKQMGSWMRKVACMLMVAAFAMTSVSALAAKDENKTRYPNTSRHEPKSDLSNQGDQKALQAAIDAVNGGD